MGHDIRKQNVKEEILFFAIFAILLYFFDVKCLFRYFFGISCPGCGMTRAYRSLLHLDIISAFNYHPLFWTVPIILYMYFRKVNDRYLIIFIIMFIAVYIVRLLNVNDSVVKINFENGLIYKILFGIIKLH